MLVKLHEDDFLSVHGLEKATIKRKKDVDGEPVNWLKVQWFRYEKCKSYSILYKYTLNEDIPFNVINVKPIRTGRPLDLGAINQEKLYNGQRVINYLKKRDMLFLLKYIPPVHHNFFRGIRGSQDVEDVGPLNPSEEDEVDADEVEEEES
uniref:Uncharacterized protein n=1 Tax=Homalodisca liturata TaxID=320908 RepID=A0A1B6J3D8_9HEMI